MGSILGGVAFWACVVLTIAFVVLWVRSYFVSEVGDVGGRLHTFHLGSGDGSATLIWSERDWPVYRSDGKRLFWRWYEDDMGPDWASRGWLRNLVWFDAGRRRYWVGGDVYAKFPHWSAVAVFGAWPAIAVWRWRRRRGRVAAGCCRVCGYDLRASVRRCPECGTALG